ncbi:glycoside hydrolase family 16 protein [Shewanella sp. Isolate13]|uniref:glycoside hydrolase family 16 protein n=1 Tax=Shewanella sp. Isolate13 TaxID=2908531 RepID=UPI001EFE8B32|nr:glycoside hydrolase family 16 protein [Shewanella sp. Isolate13]MCG9728925.1 glycoside hydrolase family 16 protein [Shewanella sp. Isolate13]
MNECKGLSIVTLAIVVGSYGVALANPLVVNAKPTNAIPTNDGQIFFDDFSYGDIESFNANGWRVRTETGHPGIVGATWSGVGISFHPELKDTSRGAIRMSSITAGEGSNTRHTQFCHMRKYLNGTYAARVFFRDTPTYGPDGDEVIQTFYTISPLAFPMDLSYSEADFEYLPNGGWGSDSSPAMWTTTWETFQLAPWAKVNEYTRKEGSYAGWRILVMTVKAEEVNYYVDGQLISTHSDKVAPEVPMSINFNLWFMPEGADGSIGPVDSDELREYQQDIDWVYHLADKVISPQQVLTAVANLQTQGVKHVDGVAESDPVLPSPCGL